MTDHFYPITYTGNWGKTEKKSKIDCLPKDVQNVIVHDGIIIVNLTDGRKGIAKQNPEDVFDEFTGFVVAYYKAKNSKSHQLKRVLTNCVESAFNKGYENAILKNY